MGSDVDTRLGLVWIGSLLDFFTSKIIFYISGRKKERALAIQAYSAIDSFVFIPFLCFPFCRQRRNKKLIESQEFFSLESE